MLNRSASEHVSPAGFNTHGVAHPVAYHRFIFDSHPSGVAIYDAQGRITDANASAERLAGVTKATGATFFTSGWPLIRKDGIPLVEEEHPVFEAIQLGEHREKTVSVLPPNGKTRRWLKVHAVPLPAESSEHLPGAYCTFTDITDVYNAPHAVAAPHLTTEQERAQRQLAQTQTRFAAAMEGAAEGFWEHDLITGERWRSDQYIAMLGYTPETFPPDYDWTPHLHPDDLNLVEEGERNLFSEQKSCDYEYRLRMPTGEYRWFYIRGKLFTDASGTPLRIAGATQDITKQKHAEDALRKSEARYRTLYARTPVMLYSIDATDRIIRVSDYWLEKTGYTRDEVLGKQSASFLTPASQEKAQAVLANFLRVGHCHDVAFELVHKEGHVIDVLLSAILEYDADGTPLHSMAVLVDVTHRKRVEIDLRKAQAHLQEAQQLARLGSFEGWLDQDELWWSEGLYALFGWNPATDRPTKDGFFALLHPEDQEPYIAALEHTLSSGEPLHQEFRACHTNGQWYDFETIAHSVRDTSGAITGIRGTVQNISERKEIQRHLAESRERLEMAILGGDLGTWDVDLETRINYFNARWAEMLGYTLDEVGTDMSIFEQLTHPDDLPRVFENLYAHARQKTPFFETEIRMRAKDGSWRWILDRGRVLTYTAEGHPKRVVGTHMDITERKQAQAALAENAWLLHEAQRVARLGSFEAYNGEEDVWWSDGFYELWGIEKTEKPPTRDTFRQLLHPEDRATYLQAIAHALETGQAFTQDFRARYATGEWRYFETRATPIFDKQDQVMGLRGTVQDITERKEQELQHEAMQTLLAEAEKAAQLGSWSWDFTTDTGQWSEEMYRLHEIPLDAPILRLENYVQQFTDAQDRERLQAKHEAFVVQKEAYDYEYTLHLTSGAKRHVWGKVIPFLDENGTLIRSMGILQDITTRVEAEQKVRESEALFRTLFEEAAMGISLEDIEGCYLRINPALERMLGYTEAELLGQHYSTITDEEDTSISEQWLAELLAGQRSSYQLEKRYRHKAGYPVWTRITVSMHTVANTPAFVIGMVEDISEQKRVTAQLEHDQVLFRHTAEIAHLGGWEFDLRTNQLTWSQKVRELHEVPDSYVPDVRSAIDFYHSDDRPRIREALEDCIRTGESFEGQYQVLTYTGRPIGVRVKGEVIQDNAGLITGVRGIFQDITETHARQERLRLLEAAVENANDGVLITNLNASTVYANPALEHMCGYTLDELLGTSPGILQGEQTDRIAASRIRDAIKRRKPIHQEILNYTKAGDPYWNELHITPVMDAHGTVTHFMSIQRDISERKRIENQLKQLSTRLSLAVRSANIGIWDLDVINDKLIWDDRMYELFQVDQDDFSGVYEAWANRVHPEDIDAAADAVRLALEGQQEFDTEFRIIIPSGKIRHIKAYATVLSDHTGSPLRMIGINYDVTEQKDKEAELIAAKEEAEAMNHLKSVFLSNMSHELRTPLVGIMGFAEILQAEAPPELQEFTGYIVSSGKRLLEIFNALLELSQLESNELVFQEESCDLAAIIHESVPNFEALAREKGLTLTMDIATPVPNVLGHDYLLRRVLHIVLSNAVKFTPAGSIEIVLSHEKQQVRLVVTDTGIGMAPEFLPAMYDPFVQESSGDDRLYEGGGIGLTLAKRYMQIMGGAIHAQSTQGEGTTFTCTFRKAIPAP